MHGRSVLTKVPNSTESLLKECAVQIPELPRYLKPSPILIPHTVMFCLRPGNLKSDTANCTFKENDALLFSTQKRKKRIAIKTPRSGT